MVPKVEKFWRVCLPKVLGRWATRRCTVAPSDNNQSSVCYCKSDKDKDSVECCNPQCSIRECHGSFSGIDHTPKTWYCPNCRTLPDFKPAQKSHDMINREMKMVLIGICNERLNQLTRFWSAQVVPVQVNFFHLSCLNFKRMPNNTSSWVCSFCTVIKAKSQQGNSSNTPQQSPAKSCATNQQHMATQPTIYKS